MKPQIFFDESGNTGDNLLDPSQPLFTLVSHNYSLDEAEQILMPLKAIVQNEEIHFKKLKDNFKNYEAIIACLDHELLLPERVHIFYTLKEFLIVVQIVDYLIEPVLYRSKESLYSDGANIAMANMMYLAGNNGWDKQLYQDMCSTFISWGRKKTSKEDFYISVKKLYSSINNDLVPEIMGLLSMSEALPTASNIFEKYAFDPALTAFVLHCSHWKKVLNQKFDAFVDTSKPIEYWRGMIEFLSNIPEVKINKGTQDYSYPLFVDEIYSCNSSDDLRIQLSDLLASSFNYGLTRILKGREDMLTKEIKSTKFATFNTSNIFPSNKVTPAQLGTMGRGTGPDTLDIIANHLKNTPGAIDKINSTKDNR